jgi:hypothetical protein
VSEAEVSLAAMIAEVERELKVRRTVYPRWVADGTLRPDMASARLAAMVAVLELLRRQDQPRLPL